MREDKLSIQSMNIAVDIINLVIELKTKQESIISNQIGRSGTSIGANIREAHYAHGTADFIAKLQIALKESNEIGYWLELLYKTNYIDETIYKRLDSKCTSIRVMLISSINTAKQNSFLRRHECDGFLFVNFAIFFKTILINHKKCGIIIMRNKLNKH